MGVSISGLVSNMDTDSIVSALVSGYTYKKDTYVKAQKKLEWKQEAWKSLNTKIYSFYKNQLSPMRFSNAFSLKSATVTSSKATVTAGSNAVTGTQKMKINQLATSGYLTGGVLHSDSGKALTGSSKLSELGIADGSKIELETGGSKQVIEVGKDTTISGLVNQLKDAGVQASFDEINQRMFVSSKKSGSEGEFELTGSNANGLDALKSLGLLATTNKDMDKYLTMANWSDEDMKKLYDEDYKNQKTENYDKSDTEAMETLKKNTQDSYEALKTSNENLLNTTDYLKACKSVTSSYETEYASLSSEDKEEFMKNLDNQISELSSKEELSDTEKTTLNNLKAKKDVYSNYDVFTEEDRSKYVESLDKSIEDNDKTLADNRTQLTKYENALSGDSEFINYVDSLNDDIDAKNEELYNNLKDYYEEKRATAQSYKPYIDIVKNPSVDKTSREYLEAAEKLGLSQDSTGAVRVTAQDAQIELNGASFTSSSNTFQINGLTINANAVTDPGEEISVTTDTDSKGIYDMVKNFFKEYNTLINEMDKLYNADSAKGYEPLTDSEKSELSDKEIDKWEQKIKDALLRRDQTLDSVSYAMKSAFQASYKINGKSYGLSSFGIKTAGYFTSTDNQKSSYHIDGDKDDTVSATNKDALLAAIASDPDTVCAFFNKLSTGVYKALDGQMKSSSLRSAYTVYNDKQMASDYKEYTKTIKKWETKISDYEERYRKQFTAMETALSKLNSQQSSLSSLLGS